jgi:hypothetical protein
MVRTTNGDPEMGQDSGKTATAKSEFAHAGPSPRSRLRRTRPYRHPPCSTGILCPSPASHLSGQVACVFFFFRPTGRPRRTSLPLECITTQLIGLVPVQTRGILPVAQQQSRICSGQSVGITDQPQCRGLWRSHRPGIVAVSGGQGAAEMH